MTVGNPVRVSIPILLASLLWLLDSCATTVPPAQTLAKEYYNLGNSWFDMKKYDQAARAYQNALTWDPTLKIATLNLARTKAELGDPAAAMDLIAPLAASEPDNMAVAQYRAWLTARWKGPAAAADLYADLARRLPGDAVTQYNAGLSLAASDRDDEALEALRQWKALDGKTPAGLTALAELLDKTGSPDAAEAWYDVVQSLPDNDARRFKPWAARARDLEAAELYGDAVAAWDQALALPAAPDQTRPEGQFRRAQILLLRIDDYDLGSAGLIDAWKAGYRDPAAWKDLLDSPLLTAPTRLQADLKLAGVKP